MSPIHHESVFGDAIVASLLANGWELGNNTDYRADLGIDTAQLFTFIGATQADEWEELVTFYGGDRDAAQHGFAKRLDQAITTDGLLDVLRKGVKDHGVRIRVAYFKPSFVESDDILTEYRKNRLTVVKELAYATKQSDWGNRLDLTLFLNGIPVATAELKNPLTGQGVEHAKEQYRTDRDPSELIFSRRVIANFAVDPDLVFVTTQLRGAKTRFLPFNTGSEGPGKPGGKGNPPAGAFGAYATSYLWEEVWQWDNWLDLLERFVHLQKEKGADGRTRKSLIFPRYHQWHAVKKLTAHAARHGAGHNYLIMASAGSGKSNTIAWLAHRLSSLHTSTDPAELDPDAVKAGLRSGSPVFDKVIIITDRRNLDSQLRDTVGSFEQTAGLVVKIDEKQGAKSEQLAKALSQETGKIVTVTLHTFPALVDYLKRNPTEIQGSKFAIIVDEAHSSQSGDAATSVRAVLRDLGLDSDSDDPGATSAAAPKDTAPKDTEAKLTANAKKRQRSANLSYFAFTATPKHKTLELFGTLDETGTYRPFHTYSMRQAIEEGFILDPLRNYVTYNTYWKLVNENPDEREVDPSKANSLLARYALTHDSTVAQHAQIVVEHFRAHTAGRLGGRAKAMVVTASRHSAVQMARSIKKYIKDLGYPDPGVLVAFSGTLTYDGEETTESKENGGLPESALPKAFAYTRADDKAAQAGAAGQREYRILVVAEKYQTGFDQPLLTTMYVNKKLAGISAVQTLSRLNRTAERKSQSDLAVLDFVNDAEDIKDAFRPYFEEAATLPSDPNLLYTAQSKVMSPALLVEAEMQAFVEAYLAAEEQAAGNVAKWEKLHAELYQHLGPAVARFSALLDSDDEDDQETAEAFRADLNDYVRKYSFLSQIVPYTDSDLERLYLYGRHLLNRLPRRQDGGVDIGEIDLSHMRVEKTGEHDVSLVAEGPTLMKGFGDGSGGAKEPEKSLLSELIEKFNEKYGTDFTEQDVIKPFEEAIADPKVRLAAVANDEENFGHVFDPVFEDKMMDHFDTIADLGQKYFDPEKNFRSSLNRSARSAAWRMIRRQEGVVDDAA
ncbi:type I restriction endonuclease subunit R [Planosporangium mesophilum]|uniref:Type I restriction endonuclease subunit R n=1 Tax=Planosporangium mesophilum TaxID=689768 RepID=A0A8J3WZV5_9ACTN|nr:DEAD/DEAH box helicase family protein [Planosporangium mesophilum]NJC83919.1 type I restriction endonuclease subunit R [Planosporangium mesophilum]GII22715.1 type I restriction endonuclease subunit R [Planosporangium mesophilum]